ncbi:MAG: hypothetical protein H6551_03235 [Chitinophagales bacterium]|nr:hypothetical protein [Chitinophagaceae bacterium]MCB9064138.1 hypothetical protein [Chitinophagales bacterium]
MKTYITLLISILLLASCSTQQLAEKYVDKEKDKYAREFIQQMIDGDTTVLSKLDTSIINPYTRENMNYLFSLLYHKQVEEIEVIGFTKNIAGDKTGKYSVRYQYKLKNNYAFIELVSIERNNETKVYGFNVNIDKSPFNEKAKFTFKGKGVKHYLALLLAIGVVVINIVSIVYVFKTDVRRKWLWVLLIIVLNIGFTFNWHFGNFYWNKLHFQFLGSGFKQGDINAPWDIYISIPIGAILFWLKRRKVLNKEQEYQELINMYAGKQEENSES